MSSAAVNERLRRALADLELGDDDVAVAAALIEVEWDAFQQGKRIAGDVGYVRLRLVGGDRAGALAVLRRLVDRGRA